MKTIRLPDPLRRGKAKLEWGTSAWAADSCLVEWSTLEREWLGTPRDPDISPRPGRQPAWGRRKTWLLGLALASALALAALAAWFAFD